MSESYYDNTKCISCGRPWAKHDPRNLALEKWMEAVTNLLNNPHPSHSDMRFIDDCLEEYKRVSKP